ncbi:MAG TPA: TauD/TfdA family dioxygenase [Solirubrobacterales bacterium]|jgi:Fe(II)/alpha-ketoglutarate-dependent arginine beta-hydroxylase|nr:TauD/TfdA family dioxygenase [Solirubrobacterales bacterium]
MLEIELTADEAIEIRRLCRSLGREYGSSDEEALLRDLGRFPEEMPGRVVEAIASYMEDPEADFALVSRHMIRDHDLGNTPIAQKDPITTKTSLEYEMVVMLYGSILGSVFGWATQQEGHLVNDIIPMETFADQQVGASSKVELAWHTEDAYHPGRADFICLFCLRNPTGAPTTVASIVDIQSHRDLPASLFEPCVRIAADDAQAAGAEAAGIEDWTESAVKPTPILSQNGTGLQMCVDPAYMSVASEDEDVYEAVTGFCQTIDEHLREVVLKPGDLLILNNHRAVHGRRPFKPTYSGRDRWLKRVNVARDFEARRPYCTDLGRRLLA